MLRVAQIGAAMNLFLRIGFAAVVCCMAGCGDGAAPPGPVTATSAVPSLTATPLVPAATPTPSPSPQPLPSSTRLGDFGMREIHGLVYDASLGESAPVAEAMVNWVHISTVGFGGEGSLLTDEHGGFSFTRNLHDSDRIIVRVSALGYETKEESQLGYQITLFGLRIGLAPEGGALSTPSPSPAAGVSL